MNTDNGGWNYVTQHTSDALNRAVVDQINTNPGISVGFFKVDHTNWKDQRGGPPEGWAAPFSRSEEDGWSQTSRDDQEP